jgi:oxygen-dependent protoporphyrinogen oxidase
MKHVFDALIISAPAEPAAKLIVNIDTGLSEQLADVYYPPVAMVFFGLKKKKSRKIWTVSAFWFRVRKNEKYSERSGIPPSLRIARRRLSFINNVVGGARNAELFEKTDAELREIVFAELKSILGLRGEPDLTHIKRWREAIPQYVLGYEKIENAIEDFCSRNAGFIFAAIFTAAFPWATA